MDTPKIPESGTSVPPDRGPHHSPVAGWLIGRDRSLPVARFMALTLLLIALIAAGVGLPVGPPEASKPATPVAALEFSRLVQDLSEPGGFFRSDNFVSNETSYLHVVDLLQELGVTGGVYLGVGPEQNFSYIAHIRPQMAFIVDIRRQAVLQHLIYKAAFQFASSRPEFLSLLLSRPLPSSGAPAADASLEKIVSYFWGRPADDAFYETNMKRILRFIQRDCHLPLSQEDVAGIKYVLSSFRDHGLDIRYRIGRGGSSGGYTGYYWDGSFPNLAEVLLGTDLEGKPAGYLAREEDFAFLRDLQRGNRIIPVVGDFAGPKALRGVGSYLRKNRLKLSAFYVSNVEQYLFQYNTFPEFAENVRTLPFEDHAVFIRAIAGRRMQHPANVPGHRLTTVLQRMSSFVRMAEKEGYPSYWELVTHNYIAPLARSSAPRQ